MFKKLAMLAVLGLAACQTVVPQWGAIGGSRGDGTVIVGYEKGEFDQDPDNTNARSIAIRRCRAWGYNSAEAFDQTTRRCIGGAGLFQSCERWQYQREYQCVNANENRNAPAYNNGGNSGNAMELRPIN